MEEVPGAPVLSLHNGGEQTTRLTLILRIVRSSRVLGAYSERVFGPWQDPDKTKTELATVQAGLGGEKPVVLDWLTASGEDIVCAFIDDDPRGRR